MRQLLIPTAALALCGCAVTTTDAHNTHHLSAPTPLSTAVETLQPPATRPAGCETCQGHDFLHSLDLALTYDTSIDDHQADTIEVHEAPRVHLEHPPFKGAMPVPPKPSADADPLEIAIWVGIASLNYNQTTPFDPDTLEPFIAAPLATELHQTASLTIGENDTYGSRGVLLDAWLTEASPTDSLTDGVAMFERTTEHNEVDIIFVDFLAHETTDGWQIIEFQVSST